MHRQASAPDVALFRSPKNQFPSVFFIAAALFLSASLAPAEGLRIYGLSSEAQSRGEAVVASGDDASSVWYNPAAIVQSGKLDVSLNSIDMYLPAQYTDLTGKTEKNNLKFFPFFGAYATSNLGTQDWAVGLGVNTPFGLATDYNNQSNFRYITTGGQITLVDVNPSVAYKVNSMLSVGAGLDYYYSTIELKQQYPWAIIGTLNGVPGAGQMPDGSVDAQGSGDGLGFNVGLLLHPAPEHSIGLTYRSQVVVKYSGKNAELTNIPAAFQSQFPAGTADKYSTGDRITAPFPAIAAIGYAYKPSDKWTWEIGGQWTNWDTLKTLDVNLDNPQKLFPNTQTKFDWYNAFAIRTGVEVKVTDRLTLSGGYFYDQSPTNEATYSPVLPDGNHHVLSVGAKVALTPSLSIRLPLAGMIQTGTSNINSRTTDATGTENTKGEYQLYYIQVGLGVDYRFM